MEKYVVMGLDGTDTNLIGVFSSMEKAADGFVEYAKYLWEESDFLYEEACDKDFIYFCAENEQDLALNFLLERYYHDIRQLFCDNFFYNRKGATFNCCIYTIEEDKFDLITNI